MSGDKIKGVLLMDFARLIHANKDLPWDKYLTEDDMELVRGRIMPATWYPMETLERVGYAVFMLIGKGDLKSAWDFGGFTIQDTFERVYKNVLFKEKGPVEIIKKFILLRKQFIKLKDPGFDVLKMEVQGENKVKVILKFLAVSDYDEAYTHQLAGGFEKLLEMSGAKDVKVKILKVQSETEPSSEIELSWSPAETTANN